MSEFADTLARIDLTEMPTDITAGLPAGLYRARRGPWKAFPAIHGTGGELPGVALSPTRIGGLSPPLKRGGGRDDGDGHLDADANCVASSWRARP